MTQGKNPGSDLNEIVVDLYNKGKIALMRRGSAIPMSVPVIATNYPLSQEER